MSRHSGKVQLAASLRGGRLRDGFTGTLSWSPERVEGGGEPPAFIGYFRAGRLLLTRQTRSGPEVKEATVVEGLYRALATRTRRRAAAAGVDGG